MGLVKQISQKSPRKSLKASASLLGLAAGAVGWSGLAQAASEASTSQMMLLPEHYELLENGVVVFKLETGENLSLTADQYLILEDGLLLIIDELAQASMDTLPVMGSVRAQLWQDLQPVRSPDGAIVQVSNGLPLWSGEGDAPRLFEQVDVERFEIAQAVDEEGSTNSGQLSTGWQLAEGGALAGGMLAAAALLSKPVEAVEEEETPEVDDQPEAEGLEYLRNWDINPGPGRSGPDDAVVFSGALYFEATDGTNGNELWKYDGVNAPSMVADINSGAGGSYPSDLTVFNGALYFRATDANGNELWKYDGVNAPSMVDDINTGSNSGYPYDLTVFNGALYFNANDGTNGQELWKFDGITPTRVTDINSGAADSEPNDLVVFNGALYFEADDSINGYELWKYDGDNAPTRVTDINTGSNSGYPNDLTVFNGDLYFQALDGINGYELWKFDGSATTRVTDINSTADSVVSNLVVFDSALFFVANSATYGDELWVYDGVNAPSIVQDLNTGSSNGLDAADHGQPRVYDGALYFEGNDGTGQELWKYDGFNFSRVTDIAPVNADIKDLTVFDGAIYFHANNGTDGGELWGYNADGWIV